jgi:hypothetical protein
MPNMHGRVLFNLGIVATNEIKKELVAYVTGMKYVKKKQQPAIYDIPKICPYIGAQSIRVSETDLRGRGVLMLGSSDYDTKMDLAVKLNSSRINQGDTYIFCCHVLNQYPHPASNRFINSQKASMHGVYIHAPNETNLMKAAAVIERDVHTFVAPAKGIGPIQPLQLGDVHALISIAGTKDPDVDSQPHRITLIPDDSNESPAYENPPSYEK